MGVVGSAFDNAMMESFWGRMQVELFNRRRWKTRIELASAIHDYIEVWHNTRRRHSALGMRTPTEIEQAWATRGSTRTPNLHPVPSTMNNNQADRLQQTDSTNTGADQRHRPHARNPTPRRVPRRNQPLRTPPVPIIRYRHTPMARRAPRLLRRTNNQRLRRRHHQQSQSHQTPRLRTTHLHRLPTTRPPSMRRTTLNTRRPRSISKTPNLNRQRGVSLPPARTKKPGFDHAVRQTASTPRLLATLSTQRPISSQ
jgi:hypothetical protein